jgi:hypothetical protein
MQDAGLGSIRMQDAILFIMYSLFSVSNSRDNDNSMAHKGYQPLYVKDLLVALQT